MTKSAPDYQTQRISDLERALKRCIEAIEQPDTETSALFAETVVREARETLRPNHYVMPSMRVKS